MRDSWQSCLNELISDHRYDQDDDDFANSGRWWNAMHCGQAGGEDRMKRVAVDLDEIHYKALLCMTSYKMIPYNKIYNLQFI